MQGDLSENDHLDMIWSTGRRVCRENLEKIGIHYDFKKNSFFLSLYRKRSADRKDALNAEK